MWVVGRVAIAEDGSDCYCEDEVEDEEMLQLL